MSLPIINIAGYRFVVLDDLHSLREQLLAMAEACQLKGSIYLAHEGINLSLAGLEEGISTFLAAFQKIPKFSEIIFRTSRSEKIPFKRLQVKYKKELVPLKAPLVEQSAPYITPDELKAWLDNQEDVILLDARNAHEVATGTFVGAHHLNTQSFNEFAQSVHHLPAEWKTQKIVTFCTGGIRCEKAAPYLQAQGFANVSQLQGGILNYLEQYGKAHYQGDCFVFDERHAV